MSRSSIPKRPFRIRPASHNPAPLNCVVVALRSHRHLDSDGATESFDSVASLPYLALGRRDAVMPAIEIPADRISKFCARHRIRRLALFGSVLRSDFRPESDIDVLVEFESGAAIGYFELARIERELSALLGGRKV